MIFFLVGSDLATCRRNVGDTLALLPDLGFTINTVKSFTNPVQFLEHIGFLLDTRDMTVSVVKEKNEAFVEYARLVLAQATAQHQIRGHSY